MRTDRIERHKAIVERRIAAPHPGPLLKRSYVDPLGLEVASFAVALGMEARTLEAMLEGRSPIDVETAVRVSRALQLPAERIMQMQVRCDFAAVRAGGTADGVTLLRPGAAPTFPQRYLSGRLGRSTQGAGSDASLFFRENVPEHITGDDYAGMHALWPGDRLRVYDAAGVAIWTGPVLHDFDGRILLPYVRSPIWQAWFGAACRADLAPGAEHAAMLATARGA